MYCVDNFMYDWSFLIYPTSKSFFKNTFLPQITKVFLYFPAKNALFVLCRLYHPFFSTWRTCWKFCFQIHYHHLLHLTSLFFWEDRILFQWVFNISSVLFFKETFDPYSLIMSITKLYLEVSIFLDNTSPSPTKRFSKYHQCSYHIFH